MDFWTIYVYENDSEVFNVLVLTWVKCIIKFIVILFMYIFSKCNEITSVLFTLTLLILLLATLRYINKMYVNTVLYFDNLLTMFSYLISIRTIFCHFSWIIIFLYFTSKFITNNFLQHADALKKKTAPPLNWQKSIFDMPNGLQNESFIVWMRISALPTFRKLYAILENGLQAGNYTMEILYSEFC